MCNFTATPSYTHKVTCLSFGIWGHVLDIINHAKFELDRFGGFRPQVAENRYLPLTRGIALTAVYALACYTVKVERKICVSMFDVNDKVLLLSDLCVTCRDGDDDGGGGGVRCSYWTCVFWMLAACSSRTVCLLLQPCLMSTHKMLHSLSLVGFSLLVITGQINS